MLAMAAGIFPAAIFMPPSAALSFPGRARQLPGKHASRRSGVNALRPGASRTTGERSAASNPNLVPEHSYALTPPIG
jgi:hypothetical protein